MFFLASFVLGLCMSACGVGVWSWRVRLRLSRTHFNVHSVFNKTGLPIGIGEDLRMRKGMQVRLSTDSVEHKGNNWYPSPLALSVSIPLRNEHVKSILFKDMRAQFPSSQRLGCWCHTEERSSEPGQLPASSPPMKIQVSRHFKMFPTFSRVCSVFAVMCSLNQYDCARCAKCFCRLLSRRRHITSTNIVTLSSTAPRGPTLGLFPGYASLSDLSNTLAPAWLPLGSREPETRCRTAFALSVQQLVNAW